MRLAQLWVTCSLSSVQSLSHVRLFGPHGLQHIRPPCPSSTPRVCSKSCPLSRWCHPTISSSVTRFSCPQSFPASGFFPVSRLFASGGQSIGASASASVLPMSIQGWSPLGLTGLISLQSKRLSRVFSNTTVQMHQFFGAQLLKSLMRWMKLEPIIQSEVSQKEKHQYSILMHIYGI